MAEIVVRDSRGCLGRVLAVLGVIVSVVFLLNFTFGVVEVPDNLPIVGHLDEVAATALLLWCLRYLGLDLTRFGIVRDRLRRKDPPGIEDS